MLSIARDRPVDPLASAMRDLYAASRQAGAPAMSTWLRMGGSRFFRQVVDIQLDRGYIAGIYKQRWACRTT